MRFIIIVWIFLFWACLINNCFADQKQAAIDHAIEAAKIQSGYTTLENKVKKYGETEGLKYVSKLGVDKELGAAVYCYKVAKDRSITFKVARDKQISLGANKTEFKINF